MTPSQGSSWPGRHWVKSWQLILLPACVVALSLSAGCESGSSTFDTYGLPPRNRAVDTSRINDQFRASGGNVFVHLTGTPGSEAMMALEEAGLAAPSGPLYDGPKLMLPYAPTTVWGSAAPIAVRDLAKLAFVTSIEPTLDPSRPIPD